ncbi:membrane protein [Vibrio sagamiensis]|nr:membrane protein [Vibrio sagamiensis]PNQ59802.1 hypothetical protein C1141_12265 [Vibrio agarivorans]
MNNNFEKDVNIGGSVERALSGNYELKIGKVLNEAFQLTTKQFWSFTPAVVILLAVQIGIFFIALKLQVGDLSALFDSTKSIDLLNGNFVQAFYIASFSYEVIGAPISAGISLMAMSHAVGFNTKTQHLGKGLQFTTPVIIATIFSIVMQSIASMVFPLLSLYLSITLSQFILLICDKRIPPMRALWLSFLAVNKKIFVFTGIYLVVFLMFIIAAIFSGIGLIFVLPFFYHLKGILYREMFGIQVKIIAAENNHNGGKDDNDIDKDDKPQVFDA